MGHLAGKDLYRKLGKKIDGLTARAPWNDSLYAILKELYSEDEAEVAVKMPYGVHPLEYIQKTTGLNRDKLVKTLESMADKGLVIDMCHGERCFYTLSPMVVGIFEFTMMRTGEGSDHKIWARLMNDYMHGDDSFYSSNLKDKNISLPLRTLPHEEAVDPGEFSEILDYEKATEIVKSARRFAIGICSCRHEKYHLGEKKCDVPLEMCSSFDSAADYLIRHNMGKEVSKEEMLENVAKARDMRLVFNADNVKKEVGFICMCCGCCCNALAGIKEYGYPNAVVTSRFIAKHDEDDCIGCGECAEACPIDAIAMDDDDNPVVDESICIGCGVCALECATESMKLRERGQRVLYPEDTFERVILQSLNNDTLQNLIFNNPQSKSHGFMRAVVGGFLKLPPVKQALMGDKLRSRFLSKMREKSR
ncbi:MAG TPA: 4Fe-4S dicluster domain-containing protein [candidate division Zixibacteria bacterium]|nr:4Fe-4S dicluster domain-containing protein [candidate division Zixibacteria bacterium]HEQ97795.1 4Fe-4S dicluster domain-containing protein [candidate division Zixibacteria bacterium]